MPYSAPTAQLQAWYGLPADAPIAPATLPVTPPSSPTSWPLAEVLHSGEPRLLKQLPARFANWPAAVDTAVPTRAVLFPLPALPGSRTTYVLLLSLSARLPVDAAYRSFLTLVADYTGRALARATAFDNAQRLARTLQGANAFLESFVHIVAHDLKGPALNLDRLLAAYAEEAPSPARAAEDELNY